MPEPEHRPPPAVTAEPPIGGLFVAVLVGLVGALLNFAL